MMRWIATMFLLVGACAGDDDEQASGESSDDSSVPDGGPCGIAGGPLAEDELHTPQIGTSAAGRPAVIVELHDGTNAPTLDCVPDADAVTCQ